MSDQTQGSLEIRGDMTERVLVDGELRPICLVIQEAIGEPFFNMWWDEHWTTTGAAMGGECDTGAGGDLHKVLSDVRERFPSAPFAYRISTEPKYEFLGDVYLYVPGIDEYVPGVDETYTAPCDADGTPVFSYEALWTALGAKAPDADANELQVLIERAYGRPWFEAFNDLPEPSAGEELSGE